MRWVLANIPLRVLDTLEPPELITQPSLCPLCVEKAKIVSCRPCVVFRGVRVCLVPVMFYFDPFVQGAGHDKHLGEEFPRPKKVQEPRLGLLWKAIPAPGSTHRHGDL